MSVDVFNKFKGSSKREERVKALNFKMEYLKVVTFAFLAIFSFQFFIQNANSQSLSKYENRDACQDLLRTYDLYSQIENTFDVPMRTGGDKAELLALERSPGFQNYLNANPSVQYNFSGQKEGRMTLGKLKVLYVFAEYLIADNEQTLSKIRNAIENFTDSHSGFRRIQILKSSVIDIYRQDPDCELKGSRGQDAFTGPLEAPNVQSPQANACVYREHSFWSSTNYSLAEDTDRILNVMNSALNDFNSKGYGELASLFADNCQTVQDDQELRYVTETLSSSYPNLDIINSDESRVLLDRHCDYLKRKDMFQENVVQRRTDFNLQVWDSYGLDSWGGHTTQAFGQSLMDGSLMNGLFGTINHFLVTKPSIENTIEAAYLQQERLQQYEDFKYTNCIDSFVGPLDSATALANTANPTTNSLTWDWSHNFNCDERVLRSTLNNLSDTWMAAREYESELFNQPTGGYYNPLYNVPGLGGLYGTYPNLYNSYTPNYNGFSPLNIGQ